MVLDWDWVSAAGSASASLSEASLSERETSLGGVLLRRWRRWVDWGCCWVERRRGGESDGDSASDSWSREMASARRLRVRGMVGGGKGVSEVAGG